MEFDDNRKENAIDKANERWNNNIKLMIEK